MNQDPNPPTGFTPGEIKVFKIHAVVVAAIAAGMGAALPPGPGRVLGVLFAVALLPIPPLVVHYRRKHRR